MASKPRWNPLAALLAVLGPAVVLGGFSLLVQGEQVEEAFELSDEAMEQDDELAALPPRIVVVGNSLAARGVEAPLLGELLGTEESVEPVAVLHSPVSRPCTWYAILENRVYQQGYRPDLVLITGQLDQMLEVEPTTDDTMGFLLGQMDADDHLIRKKVFGQEVGESDLKLRVRQRRSELRKESLEWVKDVSVGLFFGRGGGSIREQGATEADRHLERVFGEAAEGADRIEVGQVDPVVEFNPWSRFGRSLPPREGFIGDLVALNAEYGARTVFVRIPLPGSVQKPDRVEPSLERETLMFMDELGAGFLDLRDIGLGEAHFQDDHHLNYEGKLLFTNELGAALQEMGALTGGELTVQGLGADLSFTAERLGVPPEMPRLRQLETDGVDPCHLYGGVPQLSHISDGATKARGIGLVSPIVLYEKDVKLAAHARMEHAEGCVAKFKHAPGRLLIYSASEDPTHLDALDYRLELSPDVPMYGARDKSAWWVYPGTTVRLRVEREVTDDGSPVEVRSLIELFGERPGQPMMRLEGGGEAAIVGTPTIAQANLPLSPLATAAAIELSSPADGPYYVIRALSLRQGDVEQYLIGDSSAYQGASLRLIGLPWAPVEQWAALPPTIGFGQVRSEPNGEGFIGVLPVEGVEWLEPGVLLANYGLQSCSPVRVYEDGTMVWRDHIGRGDVEEGIPLSADHIGGTVRFVTEDGSDPLAGSRVYTAGLTEDRKCSSSRWIYPGDRYTVQADRRRFRWGADRVQLSGSVIGTYRPTDLLHLAIRGVDKVLYEADVPLSVIEEETYEHLFGRRLPLDEELLTLEVSTAADAPWVVIKFLVITEAPPP